MNKEYLIFEDKLFVSDEFGHIKIEQNTKKAQEKLKLENKVEILERQILLIDNDINVSYRKLKERQKRKKEHIRWIVFILAVLLFVGQPTPVYSTLMICLVLCEVVFILWESVNLYHDNKKCHELEVKISRLQQESVDVLTQKKQLDDRIQEIEKAEQLSGEYIDPLTKIEKKEQPLVRTFQYADHLTKLKKLLTIVQRAGAKVKDMNYDQFESEIDDSLCLKRIPANKGESK